MAQEKGPASEPIQKGAQAASMIRGAIKTGKALAGAAKGAARFCIQTAQISIFKHDLI